MARGRKNGVRIIAGKWRGTRLSVIDQEGLRPTADRVRETLFNWLMPYLPDARCLDLFAGTGALGFEAASRGAAEVVMVERDARVAEGLRRNALRLGSPQITVVSADALYWLREHRQHFDIVFLDPPFKQNALPAICAFLCRSEIVDSSSLVYLEQPTGPDAERLPPGWRHLKAGRTSRVRYDLVAPGAGGDSDAAPDRRSAAHH
jgi:16S rRNA (guanine966-N2)-methyltransferase